MTEMICILCPRGCHLTVGAAPDFQVTGNFCPRGAAYGREEMESPRRVVTATCPISFASEEERAGCANLGLPRRVPVKTRDPVPKEYIFDLAREIAATAVPLPVRIGDTIIENWRGLHISIIATGNAGQK